MKALVIESVGQVALREVPAPELKSGEVLLEVGHVGLCGSDLNTYRGTNPLSQLPRIPGHEIGGTIVETGPGVPQHCEIGASVIVIPYSACGKCAACRNGRANACQYNQTLGVQIDGGMKSRVAVRHERIIRNEHLPASHLALVEPLSVGFHAVSRARIVPGESVVVLGGGMIGVGAMLGALARGARVIAVEVSEEKRGVLQSLGVESVINPTRQSLDDELANLTDGFGPDVVIEAVGLPQTFKASVDLVRFAGRIVYVGYAKTEVSYNTSLFNLKELDIMGSRNATRDDFEAVIDFLSKNRTLADSLISKVFGFEDADKAFEYWEANRSRTFKVLVAFNGGGHHE